MVVRNIDGLFALEYLAPMQTTVEMFKSLADETRLRLLVLLQGGNEYCVCDLMQALDMPQSTVSRHLAYLKRNGWLQGRREGVWMYYSLNKAMDALLQTQLLLVVSKLADSAQCRTDRQRLAAHLQNKGAHTCG